MKANKNKAKLFIGLSTDDMLKAERAAKRQAELEMGGNNAGHRVFKNKKAYTRKGKGKFQVNNI